MPNPLNDLNSPNNAGFYNDLIKEIEDSRFSMPQNKVLLETDESLLTDGFSQKYYAIKDDRWGPPDNKKK